MKIYELLVILHPKLNETDVEGFVSGLEKSLSNEGASLGSKKMEYGKRLSYPIKHQTTGTFIQAEVSASPEVNLMEKINQHLMTNNDVLRKVLVTQTEGARREKKPVSVIDQLRRQEKASPRSRDLKLDTPISGPSSGVADSQQQTALGTEEKTEESKTGLEDLDKKIEELLT